MEASDDILSKYLFIMELRIDTILYSKLGNENPDAGRVWPRFPTPAL